MKRIGFAIVLLAMLAVPATVAAQYPYPDDDSSSGQGGGQGGGMNLGGDIQIGGGSVGGVQIGGMGDGGGDVAIVDFAFQPSALIVGAGETVEWTNLGNAPHTVDSNTGLFESGDLGPGGTYSYTFDENGVFPYHCDIHPNMHGMVIVSGT
jgi:plastocyanin